MKKGLKNKRGISLIVLVITIIVMIILAAAIILSLQSSGIIERANEAKSKSDMANKKQAATIAMSEYELAKQSGELSSEISVTDYIQEKLNNQGIDGDDVAVTTSGEILVGLSKAAVKAVKANIEVGAKITNYNSYLTEKLSTPTDGKEHSGTNSQGEKVTGTSQTLSTDMDLVWRYIGIDENGNAVIAADVPDEEVSTSILELGYEGGYVNGPSTLNILCEELYSSAKGKARSINFDDIVRILDYTGPKGRYTDRKGNVVDTIEPLTIGEIVRELNLTLTYTRTPDGKSIYEYEANLYPILKTNEKINNEAGKTLVFYSTEYWLADTCNGINFISGYTGFQMRSVTSSSVISKGLLNSGIAGLTGSNIIRPVVMLNDNVEFNYNSVTKECEII